MKHSGETMMMFFTANVIDGALSGSIYSLIAMAFVLIYKSSKVLNLAQGSLVLLGAYFNYSFMAQLHLNFVFSFLLSVLTCCLIVILLERFPLRPLIGQPILSIIMATIGIDILIKGTCILVWGARGWRKYPEILDPSPVAIFGLPLSRQHLVAFLITVAIGITTSIFFKRTKTGLLMRTTAEGHMVSQSMGIRVTRIIGLCWIGSAIISVFAGVLLGSMINVHVALSELALKAIPAAIVGGMESIKGAFIGGLLIGVIEALSQAYIGYGIGSITPFIVMMFILIYKPHGLFGLEIIERV
jgi:branched-chain amino acid transport system permease protein